MLVTNQLDTIMFPFELKFTFGISVQLRSVCIPKIRTS